MGGITIFCNDLNDGQSAPSASLLMTKNLRGVVDTPVGHDAIWRDLDRPEKQAEKNLMEFDKEKCEVPHLRRNNFRHQDMLGTSQLEKSFQKRTVSPREHEVEHEPATCP